MTVATIQPEMRWQFGSSLGEALRRCPLWAWAVLLTTTLALLSMARPIDHDESQYVAAAVLSGQGLLPYRDYAYLQTPLQPLLFGPVTRMFGEFAYPGLRLLNALLGALAIFFVYRAARAGQVPTRIALAASALFAGTDILLFGTGLARNDALPLALFGGALWLIVAHEGEGRPPAMAFATGLLLAAAAAAKASYALPAAAYGLWTLWDRSHRPFWIALGAAVPTGLVLALASLAPEAFWFGAFIFPADAPEQYYASGARAYKLTLGFRLLDLLKFTALGAALPALATVAWRARGPRERLDTLLELLILAGLLSAVLPEPTWRQYLLPVLPPLFLRLARIWRLAPPGAGERAVFGLFVVAGLAPTLLAFQAALNDGLPMSRALREGDAVAALLDAERVDGPVATLAPHLLPATRRLPDKRFATGPFYFRSRGLLTHAEEGRFHLISGGRLSPADLPRIVLLGGEAQWAGGDSALEALVARIAAARPMRVLRLSGGRLRVLLLDPPQAARARRSNRP
ncbi:DUF2029 domain-containing protein [Sphingomonas psychrotolerans]|uniref:DUF2029 domain-containing protein n=1 Tax=Sphingomonas psychrotolerans TaxID=1327635 RepID=A0ABU3N7D7_9SPHN|nr:DUF2029 domain-containing protein [Sphingomonas psychrotolerans]MDT8760437.1 DUF2029 domain-containing protein [Sphingomonas psychrotolerans]